MTQELFRVVHAESDGKIPDDCFPAILQYDHPKVVWLQPASQQPIPQDINKWKSESPAFLWYNDGENDYVREDALIPLFAQLQECKEQLAQARFEIDNLRAALISNDSR